MPKASLGAGDVRAQADLVACPGATYLRGVGDDARHLFGMHNPRHVTTAKHLLRHPEVVRLEGRVRAVRAAVGQCLRQLFVKLGVHTGWLDQDNGDAESGHFEAQRISERLNRSLARVIRPAPGAVKVPPIQIVAFLRVKRNQIAQRIVELEQMQGYLDQKLRQYED